MNLKSYKYILVILIPMCIIALKLNVLRGAPRLNNYKFKSNTQDSTIVGAWRLDSDSSSMIVFVNEHTCQRYHSNTLFQTDSVIISNTSPQCGTAVSVTVNTTYIQLIDKANAANHYCFEITGITNVSLAIRSLNGGPILLYYRL